MKTLRRFFLVILVAALTGCTTPSTVVVNQTVGPDLAHPRVLLNVDHGHLVVYTATEVNDPVNSYFPTHSSYRIYDCYGKLVRFVDNRSGSFYQIPAAVPLPAGSYRIKGQATNSGLVEVPVIIKEGKTTTVDLEGATLPQHKPTGAGQWVRLPDGRVIGMKVE